MGLDDSLLEVCPVLCAHVQVLVLGKLTVRMPVTPEVRMNADPGLAAGEVVGVSAAQTRLPWLRAGVPAVMGVMVSLNWNGWKTHGSKTKGFIPLI